MITIGTLKLDLAADQERFVRDLYGRWDAFNRTSLEGIVDEVLSRYDTDDELIRIELLDLDLGEIEEDEFYDRFPRKLSELLDDCLSSYLIDKDKYPDKITVIPIRQSWLEVFTHYMRRGHWPWPEDGQLSLPDLLDRLLQVSKEGLIHFLREEGKDLIVRKRLVFQLDDVYQERLVHVITSSESPFINGYARFLRSAYPDINRPEIGKDDYRNAIWLVIWGYLLSQAQGYFNRKQMVTYTLRELAAFYSISFMGLLGMLTFDLEKFASTQLFMPELLLLLREVHKETLSERESRENHSLLSLGELKALLMLREKSLAFLSGQSEERIYKIVEQVIPEESVFIIDYAKALDKEKELGMLEGKAGNDFRMLKWAFIFEVILRMGGSAFSRHQFVFSVLKGLAGHYNLTAMELLGYFYRTLTGGQCRVYPAIRELIFALYMDALDDSPADVSIYFSEDQRDTLSNPGLCRRFIRSLCEEHIYPIIERIIPSESQFIIRYAQALDKGKGQGCLEGKTGAEFRLLKWEFIFFVLFSAPLSTFSRKQFILSVLRQFAGHYNITVRELLSYFYEGTYGEHQWIPEELQGIIEGLYMDMSEVSPEPLLSIWLNEERMAYRLGYFLITGYSDVSLTDLLVYVKTLEKTDAKGLFDQLRQLRDVSSYKIEVKEPIVAAHIFAALLLFVIRANGLAFPNQSPLIRYLMNVMENRTFGDAERLRLLLHYCMAGNMDAFTHTLESLLGIRPERDPELPINPITQVVYPLNSERKGLLERLYSGVTPSLRLVIEEVIQLFRLESFGLDDTVWLEWLRILSDNAYRNYSKDGLLFLFWQHLERHTSEKELHKIKAFISRHNAILPELSVFIYQLKNNMYMSSINELHEGECVSINNAGLIIVAPFIPMLYSRLNLMDSSRRDFKDKDSQVKAIFALQSLVSDQKETPECDLVLNKLLIRYENEEPLPRSYTFDQQEIDLLEMFKKSILMNWDKMRNTSWNGFRDAFLCRAGKLEKTPGYYTLTVSEKPLDVLMDSLPWGFKLIKFPWMTDRIVVKWR